MFRHGQHGAQPRNKACASKYSPRSTWSETANHTKAADVVQLTRPELVDSPHGAHVFGQSIYKAKLDQNRLEEHAAQALRTARSAHLVHFAWRSTAECRAKAHDAANYSACPMGGRHRATTPYERFTGNPESMRCPTLGNLEAVDAVNINEASSIAVKNEMRRLFGPHALHYVASAMREHLNFLLRAL